MVGLESMQGMQREFQTICLTKLSSDMQTNTGSYKQEASEASPPACIIYIKRSAETGLTSRHKMLYLRLLSERN